MMARVSGVELRKSWSSGTVCAQRSGLIALFVLILQLLFVSAAWTQAQQPFSTQLDGKTLYCILNKRGVAISGRLVRGQFKANPSIKLLKNKLKVAKKSQNKQAIRKAKKALTRSSIRNAACRAQHESNQNTPELPPGGAQSRFAAALAVLKAQCASCHLNNHADWKELNTESAWLAANTISDQPLINQDAPLDSLLLARIKFSGGQSATMPLPNQNAPGQMTNGEYETIRIWLEKLGEPDSDPSPPPPATPTPEPPEPRGNELGSDQLFQCNGSIQASKSRIRRMGQHEWTATLGIRGSTAAFNPLVPDQNHQFSTFDEGETMNPTLLAEYMNYLPYTRTGWIDGSTSSNVPRPPEHKCMILVPPPTTQCIEGFLTIYLRGYVLFRTPTPAELARLVAFATDVVANNPRNTQEERSKVMEQITSAAWATTGALFRAEVGAGEQLPSGNFALSDEELGRSLAYTLTDQGPGNPSLMQPARVHPPLPRIQAIEDAVLNGTISSPATLDTLVAMNYAGVDPARDPHYSEFWLTEKIEQFFREWLGLDEISTSFHDTPSATFDSTGYTFVDDSFNHMKNTAYYGDEITLAEQAVEMIAKIVNNDQEVLKNLLTSREFYVPSNLESNFNATASPHAVYNVRHDIAPTRQARWNILPSNERAGILTHPAWLAAHSDNFENGPSAVLRGKWVRENLLCGIVPDIPITVDASFPPETAQFSARTRLMMATGSPACQGCHALMNPLGLPFEIYNHAGFLRASDHGTAPDGSSEIVYTGDPALDGQVSSAVDFSEKLAASPLVEQCFTRQVFRYFMGRLEQAQDACTLVAMREAYQENNGSLRAMIQTLIKSPAFTTRKPAAED